MPAPEHLHGEIAAERQAGCNEQAAEQQGLPYLYQHRAEGVEFFCQAGSRPFEIEQRIEVDVVFHRNEPQADFQGNVEDGWTGERVGNPYQATGDGQVAADPDSQHGCYQHLAWEDDESEACKHTGQKCARNAVAVQVPQVRVVDAVTERRQFAARNELVSVDGEAFEDLACHETSWSRRETQHYPQNYRCCTCAKR